MYLSALSVMFKRRKFIVDMNLFRLSYQINTLGTTEKKIYRTELLNGSMIVDTKTLTCTSLNLLQPKPCHLGEAEGGSVTA